MPWTLRFHPAVRKDLKHLSKEIARFIVQDAMSSIAKEPHKGILLHGPLRGFWKYRIGEYRIAYSIDEKRNEVLILQIGPRGGFYERLRKRIK